MILNTMPIDGPHQKLVGRWEVIYAEICGEAEAMTRRVIESFDGKQHWWTIPGNLESYRFQYRIDALQTPMHIDIFDDEGALQGIFKFDGENLVLCFADDESQPRPAFHFDQHTRSESKNRPPRIDDGLRTRIG